MVEIKWLIISKIDLKEIFDFIAKDSEKFAEIQMQKIVEEVSILKTFPKIGKVVREFNNENIRELIKGNYRIIYRIISVNRIDILMIHHGARDLVRRIKD